MEWLRCAVLADKPAEGYRDWKLISVAHEAGKLNDLRAVLGNDIAIKAYRQNKLPFPDGASVARLARRYTSSAKNNKVLVGLRSFVAGAPTNVQFIIRDSKKYSATRDRRRGIHTGQRWRCRRGISADRLLRLSRAGESTRLFFYTICTLIRTSIDTLCCQCFRHQESNHDENDQELFDETRGRRGEDCIGRCRHTIRCCWRRRWHGRWYRWTSGPVASLAHTMRVRQNGRPTSQGLRLRSFR